MPVSRIINESGGLLHYGKESHLNGEAEVENVLRHQLPVDQAT